MDSVDILHIEKRVGFLLVRLPGVVGMDNYEELETDIVSSFSGADDRVVLDLANSANIYSSGIGLILRLRKRLSATGGSLCLVNVSPRCRQVLDSTHLGDVVPIYATDVEFEVSHEEVWQRMAEAMRNRFVCLSHIQDGICRIAFSGHMLSHDGSGALGVSVGGNNVDCYVLDLTGLDAVDSHGAHLLTKLLSDIRDTGGTCVGYGANSTIEEMLHCLSLDDFLKCYDNERAALQAIGRA